MEQAQFDELVHRLEGYAARNPAGYRLRVGLLASLGYLYIFITLLILNVFLVSAVSSAILVKYNTVISPVQKGITLLIISLIVLYALWVKISPPQGVPLTRQQAPKLFDLLENIRQKLNAPKIHSVLLTHDFNASISQVPRLGFLGWQKNYLIIGLPLMQSLSPKEFSAILGHEYGHLSGAHGKFGVWIYRVRKMGNQLINSLQEDGIGSFFFKRFFNWYIPFFSAYSFVFARQNEYEADACSAKIAGKQHAAQALVNVEIKANLNTQFWDKTYKLAMETPELPKPYASLQSVLKEGLEDNLAQHWLKRGLLQPTDTVDTHPSLQDRLKALGETPQLPMKTPEKNAASYFLQDYLNHVLQDFDEQWQQNIAERWQERFEFTQQAKVRLQVLEAQASLSGAELWERARLYEEVATSAQALEIYQQVIQQDPARAEVAQLAVGRLMLQQSPAEGIALLQELLSKNADWTIEIYNVLAHYAHEQGEFAQAKTYQTLMNERIALEVAARAERENINAKDKFVEHALNTVQIQEIILQLEPWLREIKRVYLVQKQVQYLPERVCYVLAIQHPIQLVFRETYYAKFLQGIADHIKLPSAFMVISDWGGNMPIFEKVKKVPTALIYPFK